MPRFESSTNKVLDYSSDMTSNIYFTREGAPPIKLSPVQASQLFISFETIDQDAETCWTALPKDAKREYSHHLGWGCFLTVLIYNGHTYYDIRRWWLPPGAENPVPTRMGIRLTQSEVNKLKSFQMELYGAVPEIGNVEPCDCYTGTKYLQCQRCNPLWNIYNKNYV